MTTIYSPYVPAPTADLGGSTIFVVDESNDYQNVATKALPWALLLVILIVAGLLMIIGLFSCLEGDTQAGALSSAAGSSTSFGFFGSASLAASSASSSVNDPPMW